MEDKLNAEELKALSHWASFGQAGRPSSQRVTSSAWKTKPFQKPERVPWRVPIPADKLRILLNGFCPAEMEDKWFVYADGPDVDGRAKLHMHRSWTGFKVVELDIKIIPNRHDKTKVWRADFTAIKFEIDVERVRGQTEESAKRQALQVCEWVLGVTLKEELLK
jgi:hypothetical protein